MAIVVRIAPTEALSLRDPQATDLGQRILSHAIVELDALGLEAFTFRKLAAKVGCTEASVYRYFSSKHQLLLYLVAYYWDWVHHLINVAVTREQAPRARLRAALRALTHPSTPNPTVPYVDERLLHRVVLAEGTKAYHLKEVDDVNEKGVFHGYKSLTAELAALILAVVPDFPYPRALASSLFEMAHNHLYFAEHLPRLTDLQSGEGARERLEEMLVFWTERLLASESRSEAPNVGEATQRPGSVALATGE